MLAYDRHQEIVQLLEIHHSLSVKRLAQQLHVSEPTVRRDLKNMEALGLIRRTHGGAVSVSNSAYAPLALRSEVESEKKKEIARQAAAMIPEGATVFIDSGSTARYIPQFLQSGQRFTAVCNSLEICRRLTKLRIRTYCVGGLINAPDDAIRGMHAEQFLRTLHFDYAFFSCTALTDDGALCGQWEDGVSFLRALLPQAARRVFLCSSDKLSKLRPHVVCTLADVDVVLCDVPLPPNLQSMIGKNRRDAAVSARL